MVPCDRSESPVAIRAAIRNLMKILHLTLSAAAFLPICHAATVQALFTGQTQTTSGGAVTGFSTVVSASTFPEAPTLARTGTSFTTNGAGGATSYTDFNGWNWVGAGGTSTAGRSFGWVSGSTGNTLNFNLDMEGLEDLTIGMVIRSAAVLGSPLTQFSAIDYSVDGGAYFAAATGSALNFSATGNNFESFTLDLTSLLAIENAASVQIRFTLPTIPANVPDVQDSTSVRIDNVLFTAQTIPEPTSVALSLLGTGLLFIRRRR